MKHSKVKYPTDVVERWKIMTKEVNDTKSELEKFSEEHDLDIKFDTTIDTYLSFYIAPYLRANVLFDLFKLLSKYNWPLEETRIFYYDMERKMKIDTDKYNYIE